VALSEGAVIAPMDLKPASPDDRDITGHLIAVRNGGRPERDALFALVYERLKSLARHRLRAARSPTLDATALVHEAYLRFVDATQIDWQDRQHFFAAAAKSMRHIIVDHARRRSAVKRGAGIAPAPLDEQEAGAESRLDEVLSIDAALTRLGASSPRLVDVVEACYFAGLTTEEAGEALGLSARTVKREWQKAKLLLRALLATSRTP
jgi:RNA polymerase sigma factor (TIGR02999 family)